jgi:hypothetical protein
LQGNAYITIMPSAYDGDVAGQRERFVAAVFLE